MIDGVDTQLRERFAALADPTDDSSWLEVVGLASELRARRRVRPSLALAAALALGVLIAAPAVALRGHIVRLFTDAPPAQQRITKSLAALDEGVSPRLGTRVVATEARKVLEAPAGSGQTAILWLAPRAGGGFCTITELDGPGADASPRGAGGECVSSPGDIRRLSVGVTISPPHRDPDFEIPVSPDGEILDGTVLIDGWIGLKKADSLELGFQDGQSAMIPLVWVSEPVDTGFFVYSPPRLHWRRGHLPTTLVARNAEGKEIAHADITGIGLSKAYSQASTR